MYYKITRGIKDCPDAKEIRQSIFVDEQHFKNEFDDIDARAYHVVAYNNKKPVATARFFTDEDENYHIGRIAVRKNLRGHNMGRSIVSFCEERISDLHGRQIIISSQTRAKGFYLTLGYREYGEEYMDEHVPHISMKKVLF